MKKISLLLFISICFILSCAQDYSGQYTYKIPKDLGDGILVGSIREVGIDQSLIGNAVERIRKGKYGEIHSLLIYRNGKMVVEEYFPGHKYQWDAPGHYSNLLNWDPNIPHNVHSVTKSITSVCIGIAIDKGFIESVNQSIFEYLPDHQMYRSDGRENITIEHLLTMTSGLPWYEWGSPYSSNENPIIAVWFQDKDPVSFTLEAPLKYEPGTRYSYYGGSQVVLGEIIRHSSGKYIDQFAREYLFDPLGIDSADWTVRYPDGTIECAGSLRLTPRSMLKIGVTFINKGEWNGEQVVSTDWASKSATNYREFSIDVPGTDGKNLGYGYSWWIPTFKAGDKEIKAIEAGGWGGQKIFVIPDLKTVVVFTGGNYTSKTKQFTIMKQFIVPALF